MDELETPSSDTDDSDNEDHEESIEPEERYHENQQEISCEEPGDSGTEQLSVLPSNSASMERPRKSLRSQI